MVTFAFAMVSSLQQGLDAYHRGHSDRQGKPAAGCARRHQACPSQTHVSRRSQSRRRQGHERGVDPHGRPDPDDETVAPEPDGRRRVCGFLRSDQVVEPVAVDARRPAGNLDLEAIGLGIERIQVGVAVCVNGRDAERRVAEAEP